VSLCWVSWRLKLDSKNDSKSSLIHTFQLLGEICHAKEAHGEGYGQLQVQLGDEEQRGQGAGKDEDSHSEH